MSFDHITAQMDRRHWWLVNKLQESFGDDLRSAALEKFLSHRDTLPALLKFTAPSSQNPPNALFVWKSVRHAITADTGIQEQATEESDQTLKLAHFPPADYTKKCAYFLRTKLEQLYPDSVLPPELKLTQPFSSSNLLHDKGSAIVNQRKLERNEHEAVSTSVCDTGEQETQSDSSPSVDSLSADSNDPFMNSDLFPKLIIWGEIEENLTNEIRSAYATVISPYLHFTHWKECTDEQQHQLKQSIDKLLLSITGSATTSLHARVVNLRLQDAQTFMSFKPGVRNVQQETLLQAEEVAEEWIDVIEDVLQEGSFEHPPHYKGISGEIAFWRDRQAMLASITDQLKAKARQNIIGILISSQSKTVRRWRNIDGAITEATNECKDYLKFLENIRPYLQDLNCSEPAILLSSLQGMGTSAKPSGSVIRHVNASAFFQSLFMRISAEIVESCADFLSPRASEHKQPVFWYFKGDSEDITHTPRWLFQDEDTLRIQLDASIIEDMRQCEQVMKIYLDTFQPMLERRLLQKSRRRGTHEVSMTSTSPRTSLIFRGSQGLSFKGNARGTSDLSSRRDSTVSSISDRSMMVEHAAVSPHIFQRASEFLTRIRELLFVFTQLHMLQNMKVSVSGSLIFPRHTQLARDISSVHSFLIAAGDCLHNIEPGDAFSQGYNNIHPLLANSFQHLSEALIEGIQRAPSIMIAIDYVKKFEMTRETSEQVHEAITDAIVRLLEQYHSELEQIQQQYDQYKDNPPLSRCLPPTIGHMLWARHLLQRMEPPMMFFKQHAELVSSSGPVADTITLYNKLSKALITYETVYFAKWKAGVTGMLSGLKATLLVEHPSNRQLVLNADPAVFTLLDEAKIMTREQIAVPNTLKSILQQGEKFKSFSEQLQALLDKFYKIKQGIPRYIIPLLQQLLAAVSRAFRPGLISLTWDASNIDAFASRVQCTLDLLEDTTNNINQVIEEDIQILLRRIEEQDMFAMDIGEETVSLEKYVHFQSQAVQSGARHLSDLIEKIIDGVDKILQLLQTGDIASQRLMPNRGDSIDDENLQSKHKQAKLALVQEFAKMAQDAIQTCLVRALSQLRSVLENPLPKEPEKQHLRIVAHIERASPHLIQLPSSKTLSEAVSGIVEQLQDMCQVVCSTLREAGARLFQPQYVNGSPSTLAPEGRQSHSRSRGSSMSRRGQKTQVDLNSIWQMTQQSPHHNNHQHHTSPTRASPQPSKRRRNAVTIDVNIRHLENEPDVQHVCSEIHHLITKITSCADDIVDSLDRRTWAWECRSSAEVTMILKQTNLAHLRQGIEGRDLFEHFYNDLHQLVNIEQAIHEIPDESHVGGPFCLITRNLKLALLAEATAWKADHASGLHKAASLELQRISEVVNDLRQQMNSNIDSLDDLRAMIQVLSSVEQHSQDLDVSVLERIFEVLHEIGLTLPREEVQALEQLRRQCADINAIAQEVTHELTTARRPEFERLLDTQAKALMVATIHLRNSFDNSGPTIEGITPHEALVRLRRLTSLHKQLEEERQTLVAVESLLGFPPTPYPELERTSADLRRLDRLYGLYERFVSHQQLFLETFWAEASLFIIESDLRSFASSLQSLPESLKKWQAFKEMKKTVSAQLKVIPLLHLLAMPSIRDRHWREVMHMTGITFPLEGLTIRKVLSLKLLKYANKIHELARSAVGEAELEKDLNCIQEEWSDHVFPMEPLNENKTVILLDVQATQDLITSAQESHMQLHAMLSSPSLGPHRTDLVAWLAKLREISAFLTQWLEVQKLWRELEVMIHVPELSHQTKRLHGVARDLYKFGLAAQETSNILQFCFGGDGEGAKTALLMSFYERLEDCRKSISLFLNKKREAFPRFYFLSDMMLLRALGTRFQPGSNVPFPESLKLLIPAISAVQIMEGRVNHDVTRLSASSTRVTSPSGIQSRRRLAQDLCDYGQRPLLIVKLISCQQEEFKLSSPVVIVADVTSWLTELLHQVRRSLRDKILDTCANLPNGSTLITMPEASDMQPSSKRESTGSIPVSRPGSVEKSTTPSGRLLSPVAAAPSVSGISTAGTYQKPRTLGENFSPLQTAEVEVNQVSILATRLYWTSTMALGIDQVRVNRFALRAAQLDVVTWCNKMVAAGMTKRKNRRSHLSQLKYQSVVTLLLHLRDLSDEILNARCRDLSDFAWMKQLRWQLNFEKGIAEVHSLYTSLCYGSEYIGIPDAVHIGSLMDKYHTMLMQILVLGGGLYGTPMPAVSAPANTGKQTVIRALANMLGRNLFQLDCTAATDPASVQRIVKGLCLSHSWGLLSELSELSHECLSVAVQHIRLLHLHLEEEGSLAQLMQNKMASTILSRDSLKVSDNAVEFAMFATMSSAQKSPIPETVRSCFRIIEVAKPSFNIIVYAHCLASGLFTNPKIVAEKTVKLFQVSSEAFQGLHWLDFGLDSLRIVLQQASNYHDSSSIILSQASSLCTSLGRDTKQAPTRNQRSKEQVTNPTQEDLELLSIALAFFDMYQSSVPESDLDLLINVTTSTVPLFTKVRNPRPVEEELLEESIKEISHRIGLIPELTWVHFALNIYRAVRYHRTVFIVGPCGSGKTSALRGLIAGLNRLAQRTNDAKENISSLTQDDDHENFDSSDLFQTSNLKDMEMPFHREHRLYPAATGLQQLFGFSPSHNEWVDGIVPTLIRQASTESGKHTIHWIVFDGPCDAGWVHFLRRCLSNSLNSYFPCGNGDKIRVPENIKFIFEMTPLESEQAVLFSSSSSAAFLNKPCITWRAIVKPWLATRRAPEAELLEPLFNRYMEPMLEAVDIISGHIMRSPMVARVHTLVNLLSALLADSVNAAIILPPVHIECIFLFALTWGLGGTLDLPGRHQFHQELGKLSSLVPNDNDNTTMFDYCLSPTADWETWQDSAESLEQENANVSLSDGDQPFLLTREMTCATFLLDSLTKCGSPANAMIVGHGGTGRSALLQQMMHRQRHLSVVRNMPVSGVTSASTIQEYMTRFTSRRTGHVYGAEGGKPLLLLVDDIDACTSVQRTNLNSRASSPAQADSVAPAKPTDITMHAHEVLRLLLEEGSWFPQLQRAQSAVDQPTSAETARLQREACWITDLSVMTTCLPEYALSTSMSRLARHMSVFYLPPPDRTSCISILTSSVQDWTYGNHDPDILLQETEDDDEEEAWSERNQDYFRGVMTTEMLSEATYDLLIDLNKYMKPTHGDLYHYVFNLRDAVTVMKGIRRCSMAETPTYIMCAFWVTEALRVFGDRMISEEHHDVLRQRIYAQLSQREESLVPVPKDVTPLALSSEIIESNSQDPRIIRVSKALEWHGMCLLDVFARLVSGNTHLSVATVPVNRLVEDVHTLCSHAISKEEVSEEFVPIARSGGLVDYAAITRLMEAAAAHTEPQYSEDTITSAPWPSWFADFDCASFMPRNKTMTAGSIKLRTTQARPSDQEGRFLVQVQPLSFPSFRSAVLRALTDQNQQQQEQQQQQQPTQFNVDLGHMHKESLNLVAAITRLCNMTHSHGIFVVPTGGGLSDAIQVSARLSGCRLITLNVRNLRMFHNDMRAVYRLAGSKNQPVCCVMDGEQLAPEVMDHISSFMLTGAIFNLFAAEEEAALYDGVIADAAKRASPGLSPSQFFHQRLQYNVHLIFRFQSVRGRLKMLAASFPNILRRSYFFHSLPITPRIASHIATAALFAKPSLVDFSSADLLQIVRGIVHVR